MSNPFAAPYVDVCNISFFIVVSFTSMPELKAIYSRWKRL